MHDLGRDVLYAFRTFRRHPAFVMTAGVILALGIGASTTVFSVVDHVLLRPLPYPDNEKLVYFDDGSHPGPLFQTWQEKIESFDGWAATSQWRHDLTGDGDPVRVNTVAVSRSFFELFAGRALFGRLFAEDDYASADTVPLGGSRGGNTVVLSHAFWRERWADEEVLDRTLTLSGKSYRVIGVVGPGFVPPEALDGDGVDLWMPLDWNDEVLSQWNYYVLSVVGRLRADASLEKAQAEVEALDLALADEYPDNRIKRDGTPVLTPLVSLHEATVGRAGPSLWMLLGAVGLLLLIACVNVANLCWARGAEREREIALRSALGASGRRITRQLLAETLLLSLFGAALGVGLAVLGVRLFAWLEPGDLPRLAEVAVDLRILIAATLMALIPGAVFGLMPAWQASRRDLNAALKDQGTAMTAGRRRFSLRQGLVVAEVALALVLLAGAGLLFHSMLLRFRTDPGFDSDNLVRMPLGFQRSSTEEERAAFTRQLLEKVEAIPGINGVAAGWRLPFEVTGGGRCCWRTELRLQEAVERDGDRHLSIIHPVTDGYFQTLGITLLRGRGFEPGDEGHSPLPAVINRPAARRLFGDEDPIGRTLFLGRDEPTELRIVGLTGDVKHWGVDQDEGLGLYLPYAARGAMLPEIHLAARLDVPFTAKIADQLRAAVWEISPQTPVTAIGTFRQQISTSLDEPRFYAALLGTFAFLSLALAAAGLYGSLLYLVGQRSRELGIRLAVGARSRQLLGLVLRQGLTLAGAGVILGLFGAFLLARTLESQVYGIAPRDPKTFAVVAVVLVLAAFMASWVPARKAARTDPVDVLRTE